MWRLRVRGGAFAHHNAPGRWDTVARKSVAVKGRWWKIVDKVAAQDGRVRGAGCGGGGSGARGSGRRMGGAFAGRRGDCVACPPLDNPAATWHAGAPVPLSGPSGPRRW